MTATGRRTIQTAETAARTATAHGSHAHRDFAGTGSAGSAAGSFNVSSMSIRTSAAVLRRFLAFFSRHSRKRSRRRGDTLAGKLRPVGLPVQNGNDGVG